MGSQAENHGTCIWVWWLLHNCLAAINPHDLLFILVSCGDLGRTSAVLTKPEFRGEASSSSLLHIGDNALTSFGGPLFGLVDTSLIIVTPKKLVKCGGILE